MKYKDVDLVVMVRAIAESAISYSNIPKDLWRNRSFADLLLKDNGWALEYFSNEIKNSEDLVLKAVLSTPRSFHFASDNLKLSKVFIYKLLKHIASPVDQKRIFGFIDESIHKDKEFIKKILNMNGSIFTSLNREMGLDIDVVLSSINKQGESNIFYLTHEHLKNFDNISKILKKYDQVNLLSVLNIDKFEDYELEVILIPFYKRLFHNQNIKDIYHSMYGHINFLDSIKGKPNLLNEIYLHIKESEMLMEMNQCSSTGNNSRKLKF